MAVINQKWTFFYFIVVAQQKTKSNYVKFIEKTFNFFGDIYLETHGQSCISVSSWPWISEEVKGTNKKIERIHCEYYQSKKKVLHLEVILIQRYIFVYKT